MKNNTDMPSLHPYLDGHGAKTALSFLLVSHPGPLEGKSPFPFVTVDASGPFSRVLKARFVTDAGSRVGDAFVVIQQDIYPISNDPLRPLNNKDVEAYWQRAFSFLSKNDVADALIVFGDQAGEDGRLLPFQPLFYCKLKEAFFHPPCPVCGRPLQQCYDDSLLASQGLQTFSGSLKRYLFCPDCLYVADQSDFYVFELDGADPPTVKDRWDLIKAFGQLTNEPVPLKKGFPCAGCSEAQKCHGAEGQAATRIVPFCFYPFFMFAVPAMSLKAEDFLAIVSGASPGDLAGSLRQRQEIGRADCLDALQKEQLPGSGFLFEGDPRHFLEVLYLKLCLMGALFQTLGSGPDCLSYPDMGPSLDCAWVKLGDQSGLLPYFWNFKVGMVGVGANRGQEPSAAAKALPPNGLRFMGLVWFLALFVNKAQDMSDVYAALTAAAEKWDDGDDGDSASFSEALGGLCAPENIYWDPSLHAGLVLDGTWLNLWRRAIAMGEALLHAGMQGDGGFSRQAFWQELQDLRQAIRQLLFQQQPVSVVSKPGKPGTTVAEGQDTRLVHDRAIGNILDDIAARWQAALEAQDVSTGSPEAVGAGEIDMTEETVILTPGAGTAPDTTAGVSGQEDSIDDDVHETVILSAEDFKEQSVALAPEEQDAPEQTVMVSASQAPGTLADEAVSEADRSAPDGPSAEPGLSDDMPETVMISAHDIARGSPDGVASKDKAPMPAASPNDMPETVMISPDEIAGVASRSEPQVQEAGATGAEDAGKPGGGEDEDLLAETVMISPDHLKKGKK